MVKKTDPVKKKKKTNGTKKKTDPVKNKKVTSTAKQRNSIRRKKYLNEAYKSGADTTKVSIRGKKGMIDSVGASKKRVGSRNKPTVRAHYKNRTGGVTRTSDRSPMHRQISRGYKVEKEKGTAKKKVAVKRKKK